MPNPNSSLERSDIPPLPASQLLIYPDKKTFELWERDILYMRSQIMHGRGEVGLLEGNKHLVWYFKPDAALDGGRLLDIEEIWFVTDADFTEEC